MSEKDKVYKGKFKTSGIFNFKDFYEYFFDVFMEANYDVFETGYIEKLRGDTKEINLTWTATNKVSNYFDFVIDTRWILLGLKKVKVKKDGQEETMDSGSMEVSFTATLIKDPSNQWDNSILKTFRWIYDKFIIKERINQYEIKLYEDVNEFINDAKAYLAIEGRNIPL